MRLKTALCGLSLAASAFSDTSLFAQSGKGKLLVYSIVNQEESQLFADLFEQETGVKVSFLRAATGDLINRVIAEKDAPKADVLLGGPSSLHISAADEGAPARPSSRRAWVASGRELARGQSSTPGKEARS